jgi:hypothetical protein
MQNCPPILADLLLGERIQGLHLAMQRLKFPLGVERHSGGEGTAQKRDELPFAGARILGGRLSCGTSRDRRTEERMGCIGVRSYGLRYGQGKVTSDGCQVMGRSVRRLKRGYGGIPGHIHSGGDLHLPHKAIAKAGARLNEPLRTPRVPESLPHCPQSALQRRGANTLCGPDVRTQLVLGNNAVAVLQEIEEHVEDFGPQADSL